MLVSYLISTLVMLFLYYFSTGRLELTPGELRSNVTAASESSITEEPTLKLSRWPGVW
jgi:hypothetical protein